jgi:hypothetical protein
VNGSIDGRCSLLHYHSYIRNPHRVVTPTHKLTISILLVLIITFIA